MTELIVLPYAARLAVGFLLETLDAGLAEAGTEYEVGANIGTDAPNDTYPFVRVAQVAGTVVEGSSIHWLGEWLLQIDVWGPGGNDRITAHTIAEVASALFSQRLSGAVEYTIGGSTVSAVVSRALVGGVIDDEDTALKPPRPTSRFDVLITAHPLPAQGS